MERVKKILKNGSYIRDNLNPSLRECDRIASLLEEHNKYHKVICFPNDSNFYNVRDDLIKKIKNKHYIEANESPNFKFPNINGLKLLGHAYSKSNSPNHMAVVWAKKRNWLYRFGLKIITEILKIFTQLFKILSIS